jgi:ParB-like chromosome segregation protein Spo0J
MPFKRGFMKETISKVMVERIERWPIKRLIPYVGNARTHSEAQIAEVASSIAEFGFVHPVLVAPDGVIVAGHCRVLAAGRLGLGEVPVVVLEHLSEAQRKALAIADNRLALNAGWDEEMLRRELAALEQEEFPVELLGFDARELDRLLVEPEVVPELPQEEAVPKPPRLPVSRAGDLWICGVHRVRCGDPLDWPEVERLMDGDSADLVFTEPPVEKWIASFSQAAVTPAERAPEVLLTLSSHYRRLMKPTAALYIGHPAAWQRELQNALESAGFAIACQIVRAWQSFLPGSQRYQLQHAPLFYAHVAGQVDAWYGDRGQSTVWNQEQADAVHHGMPVEMVERILINSSRPDDVVVDLCAGSATGLMACERLGRRARIMSNDPRMVDAVVMRWQQSTGRSAVHEGDSQSFAEILAHRQLAAA